MHLGSGDAAEVACTWLSLIASARHAGLDSEEYLRDLCRVLPSWPRNRVIELTPMNWLATRARLPPKELEAPLGKITIPPPLGQTP